MIRPQPGPQEQFLGSEADIVIYGGGAGGGKTYGLLLDPVRYIDNAQFSGVIFRRTTTQIKNPGGIWDESNSIYPLIGGDPKTHEIKWKFPTGATIKFGHLEYEKNVYDHQGAQYAFIGFDELTHFTKQMFLYLLSRNRSLCGVKPYIRCTCNPDADSWVKDVITWWLDENGEYPDPLKSGAIRYFIIINNEFVWGNSKKELRETYSDYFEENMREGVDPDVFIKSLTFIPAKVEDNQILLRQNPEYLANLLSQSEVEKERLLNGNWKIKAHSGSYFKRTWFEPIQIGDFKPVQVVRNWDLASTRKHEGNKDPDSTACIKMAVDENGYFVLLHGIKKQEDASEITALYEHVTKSDGESCISAIEQEPGSSGKYTINYLKELLPRYPIIGLSPGSQNKETRALPVAALAANKRFRFVPGDWSEEFFDQIESFPESSHDDYVDALVGAWRVLSGEVPEDRIFAFDTRNIVPEFEITSQMFVQAALKITPTEAHIVYRAIDENNNWYYFLSEVVKGSGEEIANKIVEKKTAHQLNLVEVVIEPKEKIVSTLMENTTLNDIHSILYYEDIHLHVMKSDVSNGVRAVNKRLVPISNIGSACRVFQNMPTLIEELNSIRYEKQGFPKDGYQYSYCVAMLGILNTRYSDILKNAGQTDEGEDEDWD